MKKFDPEIHKPHPDKAEGHLFHYIWGFCENCGHSIADPPRKCDPTVATLIFRTTDRCILSDIVNKAADGFCNALPVVHKID